MVFGVMFCTMIPRFIISVRELYDHDLRRSYQGVDTGFGVLSHSTASQSAAVSEIAFADVAPMQDQDMEGNENEPEVIQFEPLGDNMGQV